MPGQLSHYLNCHRKWREKNERASKSLKSVEDELSKSQKKVRKLQEIADDRKLEERDELSRRLSKAEQDLDDRNHRVQVSMNVCTLLLIFFTKPHLSNLHIFIIITFLCII